MFHLIYIKHKEDDKSRQKRDTKDTMIFASFLEERNPFINEDILRNIETGVSATVDVNVDNAKQVGDRILSSMESKSVSEYSFKRKYQAVTLQDKPTIVDIETGQISIDPQLLFQRFIVAADSIYEDRTKSPHTFDISLQMLTHIAKESYASMIHHQLHNCNYNVLSLYSALQSPTFQIASAKVDF
jgi:hypothetical protein